MVGILDIKNCLRRIIVPQIQAVQPYLLASQLLEYSPAMRRDTCRKLEWCLKAALKKASKVDAPVIDDSTDFQFTVVPLQPKPCSVPRVVETHGKDEAEK